MIDVEDVFQHIADDDELNDRAGDTPQNIFFQPQLFPVADHNRHQHQDHRQRQRFVGYVMFTHGEPPAFSRPAA